MTMQAKELSMSSYQQWVNAMVNLSERQKKLHLVNSAHPNPRGTLIKDFIGNRRLTETARKEASFEDRGVGTFADGYTREEMLRLSEHTMNFKSSPNAPNTNYRTRCDFFVGHATLLRGDWKWLWQLPDLMPIDLPGEGPTPCEAMVIVLRQGKTNKFGRLEYSGMMRTKDVRVCPIGASAIYMFD